jgi:hypothetical protein
MNGSAFISITIPPPSKPEARHLDLRDRSTGIDKGIGHRQSEIKRPNYSLKLMVNPADLDLGNDSGKRHASNMRSACVYVLADN